MSEAEEKIDTYLLEVGSRLRGLGEEQTREIVAELRSHIVERASGNETLKPGGVDAALAALGSPEELARQYVTDTLLARAEVSLSPFRLVDTLFGWASVSIAGFFVTITSIVGYVIGVVFILVALLKPLHPADAGLWALHDSTGDLELSVRMGFGTPPSNGHELLGWWIIPLGLVTGCGLVVLTTRFALWCVRVYRQSRLLPRRG
jgi:hypothetical protein